MQWIAQVRLEPMMCDIIASRPGRKPVDRFLVLPDHEKSVHANGQTKKGKIS
jgi:hypothetical protein